MSAAIRPRRQFETLTEAAIRPGHSVRALRRRSAAGLLPAFRGLPRLFRVDPADVDRLMVRVPECLDLNVYGPLTRPGGHGLAVLTRFHHTRHR